MEPLRISIIGIDGSDKSSTTLKALYSLSHQFPICKTGRTPFSIWNENIAYCLPKTGKFFEDLFKRIDATKKRQWIGTTRILFVFFQGWLEPYMINRYHPAAVITTRCMVIDSPIYSDFYYPWISRKLSVEGKLRPVRHYTPLPFRDLYFFLVTPIQMAMERIYKRISNDHPEISYGRDYWLHLHEHEESLQRLDRKFKEALQVAQRMAPMKVVEIDTGKRNEEEVAQLISRYSSVFCVGDPLETWAKI
jgi:hypothetical protein